MRKFYPACLYGQEKETCLIVASWKNNLDVVKYLCERGGDKLLMQADNVSVILVCVKVHTDIICMLPNTISNQFSSGFEAPSV